MDYVIGIAVVSFALLAVGYMSMAGFAKCAGRGYCGHHSPPTVGIPGPSPDGEDK